MNIKNRLWNHLMSPMRVREMAILWIVAAVIGYGITLIFAKTVKASIGGWNYSITVNTGLPMGSNDIIYDSCVVFRLSGNGTETRLGTATAWIPTGFQTARWSVFADSVNPFRKYVLPNSDASFTSDYGPALMAIMYGHAAGDTTDRYNLPADVRFAGMTRIVDTTRNGGASGLTAHDVWSFRVDTMGTNGTPGKYLDTTITSIAAASTDSGLVNRIVGRTVYGDPTLVTSALSDRDVNVQAVYGDTAAANRLRAYARLFRFFTVNDAAPLGSKFKLSGLAEADDYYNNFEFAMISGGIRSHRARVYDFDGTNDTAYFDPAFVAAPANGDTGIVFPTMHNVNVERLFGSTTQSTQFEEMFDNDGVAAILEADSVGLDGSKLAANTGAITAATLATDAIGAPEIATDAIGAAELAPNAIGASELADDAIDAGAIATDALGASEIAVGAIEADALAANSITSAAASSGFGDELALAYWGQAFATAFPAGSMGDSLNNGTYVRANVSALALQTTAQAARDTAGVAYRAAAQAALRWGAIPPGYDSTTTIYYPRGGTANKDSLHVVAWPGGTVVMRGYYMHGTVTTVADSLRTKP